MHPHLPERPDASLSLGTLTLKDPWETVLFNDRASNTKWKRSTATALLALRHRAADAETLKDGTDTMLRDGSLVTLEQSTTTPPPPAPARRCHRPPTSRPVNYPHHPVQ